jgi:hypothetical protein
MSTEQERRAVIQGMVDGKRDWSRDRTPESWTAIEAEADGAITALDTHRAEDVRAAVERLEMAMLGYCPESGVEYEAADLAVADARREVLALLGVTESS